MPCHTDDLARRQEVFPLMACHLQVCKLIQCDEGMLTRGDSGHPGGKSFHSTSGVFCGVMPL